MQTLSMYDNPTVTDFIRQSHDFHKWMKWRRDGGQKGRDGKWRVVTHTWRNINTQTEIIKCKQRHIPLLHKENCCHCKRQKGTDRHLNTPRCQRRHLCEATQTYSVCVCLCVWALCLLTACLSLCSVSWCWTLSFSQITPTTLLSLLSPFLSFLTLTLFPSM